MDSPTDSPQQVPSPYDGCPSPQSRKRALDSETIEVVERLLYDEQVACIDVCWKP